MNPLALIAAAVVLIFASKSTDNTDLATCNEVDPDGGTLGGIAYTEIVTAGADAQARLPMVISLHGLGYDQTAHIKWLEGLNVPARVILPNGLYSQDGSATKRTWWPSYSNTNLQAASETLAPFVELIAKCRPTVGKPVITGHSMGGFVALDFATQFPQLISATVPVATTRSSLLWDIEPKVPVHGIHGQLDNSYDKGASYYQEMANRGLPVAMTTVPTGGHGRPRAATTSLRPMLLPGGPS